MPIGARAQNTCGTVSTCPNASTPFEGTEILYLVQKGVSKKTTTGAFMGQVQSGLPSVVNNAALRAIPSAVAAAMQGIVRLGFTAAGDSPPLTLNWQSICPGTADNLGYLIAPTSGGSGCWKAAYEQVVDAREFGIGQNADDTSAWHSLDLAVAAGMPGNVYLGTTSTMALSPSGNAGSCFQYIRHLFGTLGVSQIDTLGTITSNGYTVCYIGTGPFEIDHIKFVGPLPNWASSAVGTGSGDRTLQIDGQYSSPTTQIGTVSIHDNIFIGGNGAIGAYTTAGLDIYNNRFEQVGGFGIVASSAQDSFEYAQSSDWWIHDNHCKVTGGDCYSLLVDQNTGNAAPPRRVHTHDNTAVASSIFLNFPCFELTTTAANVVDADDDVGVDCPEGGMEAKLAFEQNVTALPEIYSQFTVRNVYHSHIDTGTGLSLQTENPYKATAQMRAKQGVMVDVDYQPAGLWQANSRYNLGDTADIGGYVEVAVVPGTSGSSQPSGDGKGTTDGSVTWYTLHADPANEAVFGAVPVGGSSGSSYANTDILSAACASGGTAALLQPTVQSGAIIALRILFEGQCPSGSLPSNPVSLTGGSGSGGQATLQWNYIANSLVAVEVDGGSDQIVTANFNRVAYASILVTRGGMDQTIRRLLLTLNGTVEDTCLQDSVESESWPISGGSTATIVQNGNIVDSKLIPRCEALGQANGAIVPGSTQTIPSWQASSVYFQNALVINGSNDYIAQCASESGCESGSSGGPTGTGTGIADGSNGLTWNYYSLSTVAFETYQNFQIVGGYIVNDFYGVLYENAGILSFNGSITDTRMVGGLRGLYLMAPTTLTIDGGSLKMIGNASGQITSAPIAWDKSTGTGSVTIQQGLVIVHPWATDGKADYADTNSAAGTVSGALFDTPSSSTSAAPTHCALGEYSWPSSSGTPRGYPFYCEPANTWN